MVRPIIPITNKVKRPITLIIFKKISKTKLKTGSIKWFSNKKKHFEIEFNFFLCDCYDNTGVF